MKLIHYVETNFGRDEQSKIDAIRKAGLYVYHLRNQDGHNYTIETVAWIDNIGFLISDTKLEPYMHEGVVDESELFNNKDIHWVWNPDIDKDLSKKLIPYKCAPQQDRNFGNACLKAASEEDALCILECYSKAEVMELLYEAFINSDEQWYIEEDEDYCDDDC